MPAITSSWFITIWATSLLQKQPEHEPEKGEWCESTVQEIAKVAERQPQESGPAHGHGNVQHACAEPERGEDQAKLDLPITPRSKACQVPLIDHVVPPPIAERFHSMLAQPCAR
jgi:hypothetical protein